MAISRVQIWVAVISAVGVIVAATIPSIIARHSSSASISGLVREVNGGPITDAQVTIFPNEGSAVTTVTDSSGAFRKSLNPVTNSARVTVDATGFRSEVRQFNPQQEPSLEIALKRLQNDGISVPEANPKTTQPPESITIGDVKNQNGTVIVGSGNRVRRSK